MIRTFMLPKLLVSIAACIALVMFAGCAKSYDKYAESIAKQRKESPEEWAEYDLRSARRKAQEKEITSVNVTCIPHGIALDLWYVEEILHGQSDSREFGGSLSCGGVTGPSYPVPNVWVPGLQVRVRWSTYVKGQYPASLQWHEAYTTIPPYDEVGSAYVHIFPGDQVRVVISNVGASGKAHPIDFDAVSPLPEDPSHVPIPVSGVNLDCVVHGKVPMVTNTDIKVENPNFSNPVRTDFSFNTKYLRMDTGDFRHNGDLTESYIKGCRMKNSLQVDTVWQPNKTIKVSWARDPTREETDKKNQYVGVFLNVAVPRYDKPMNAWLHLFPGDQARLVFSNEPPDSPNHPIPRDALVPPPDAQ